ncbi:MAG: CotH kinase family protein [Desulfofustis sp.]|nr:CotH kinase family protein [Desulfofustis sp.]
MVILLAVIVQHHNGFAHLKHALQVRSVGSGVLDYGTMGTILKRLELVTVKPNDFNRFKPNGQQEDDLETIVFQKKRQVGDYVYVANPEGSIHYRSTALLVDKKTKPGWPIVSIATDEAFLHDPETGILANRAEKGRAWEKIADISYIENGEVLFETRAGLRMHGGLRLSTGEYTPGFRLYFRKKYGLAEVPSGLILPDLEIPLRTVVLQTSAWPPGYPLNNPIAYDIARHIGGIVPTTRLVEIYLNGKPYSMGFATEHLSRRQWGQRYGDTDYFFVKYRSKNPEVDLIDYRRKINHLLDRNTVLSVENVSEELDLSNLTAQVIAWSFCGTSDYYQGVAVGRKEPGSRIFWITWDMDHSFWDEGVTENIDRAAWQQPAFERFFQQTAHRICWRTDLFSRLIWQDQDYQSIFLMEVNKVLNHLLTPSYLDSLLSSYREKLAAYGDPHDHYFELLETFFDNRPAFIRQELQTILSLNDPATCRITIPEDVEILVDGFPYHDNYQGVYFNNTPVTLELADSSTLSDYYWLVNNEKRSGRHLELTINKDTEIALIAAAR